MSLTPKLASTAALVMAEVVDQMLTGSLQGTLCGHEVELDMAGPVPPDL